MSPSGSPRRLATDSSPSSFIAFRRGAVAVPQLRRGKAWRAVRAAVLRVAWAATQTASAAGHRGPAARCAHGEAGGSLQARGKASDPPSAEPLASPPASTEDAWSPIDTREGALRCRSAPAPSDRVRHHMRSARCVASARRGSPSGHTVSLRFGSELNRLDELAGPREGPNVLLLEAGRAARTRTRPFSIRCSEAAGSSRWETTLVPAEATTAGD